MRTRIAVGLPPWEKEFLPQQQNPQRFKLSADLDIGYGQIFAKMMKLVSLYFAITSDKWVSHPGGNLKILIFEIHHPPLLRTCTSRIMQISFANENLPQNILEALTPCSSFHFLDLRFRFTFDFA